MKVCVRRRADAAGAPHRDVAAWDAARHAAEAVAQAGPWRQALADRLHEAAGGHHATVFICPPGRPERGHFAVSPAACGFLEERIPSEIFLPLQHAGESWPRLDPHRGVLVPAVEALHGRPVAAALRAPWLAPEGVAGYLCAFPVTPRDELAGWIEIGATRLAALAALADALRDVADRVTRTLAATLDLAESCGATFPEPALAHDTLSTREREIVALVIEGLSDLNIAAQLSICESTVGSHLHRVYKKLGVHTRVELVQRSRRAGAR